MKTIVIVLDGGLVSAVVADEPMPDLQIVVIDYDTDGAEKEDILRVPQCSPHEEGKVYYDAQATGHMIEVTKAGIGIQSVIQQIKERDKS